MNIMPRSPWYPLAVAAALAPDGPPRVVTVPFEQWLVWRANVSVSEQSAESMLATVRGAFA